MGQNDHLKGPLIFLNGPVATFKGPSAIYNGPGFPLIFGIILYPKGPSKLSNNL